MYYIHIVKRFRAHCGFYAIENKLLLLLLFMCVIYAEILNRIVFGSIVWTSINQSNGNKMSCKNSTVAFLTSASFSNRQLYFVCW